MPGTINGLFMNTHSLQKAKSLGFPLLVIQDEGQPLDLIKLHTSVILSKHIHTGKTETTDIEIHTRDFTY